MVKKKPEEKKKRILCLLMLFMYSIAQFDQLRSVLKVWNRTVAPMVGASKSCSEPRVLHSMLFRDRQDLSDAVAGH